MEQRQLRLGDTLDDYCPRERRLTNHAIVAMVGAEVKQTRCTTCEAEHEYKHAKVPRQRKKADSPAALYAQVAAGAPKRSVPLQAAAATAPSGDELNDETAPGGPSASSDDRLVDYREPVDIEPADVRDVQMQLTPADDTILGQNERGQDEGGQDEDDARDDEEGPVHRQLIRASLPREGQPPPSRPIPEFTIRQPAGRPGRFRPRPQHGGGQQFQGNRSNGNGPGGPRGSGPRQGGRPPQGSMPSRLARRTGPGRKRSK